MQYCSLQHGTFLSPPDTSTTGYCFIFGSASSFLLELFLHSSPVAYWVPTDLGSSSFSVIYFFFPCSYCSWGSQGKNVEVVCHSLCSRPCFVRALHCDPSVLGDPTQYQFSSVTQSCPTLCDLMNHSMPGFLSITNSQSLIKLVSMESVMPSNHLILRHPLPLLPSIISSIRVFSSVSVLHITWPKYWSFSFTISLFQ